jgi:hypothetical protein
MIAMFAIVEMEDHPRKHGGGFMMTKSDNANGSITFGVETYSTYTVLYNTARQTRSLVVTCTLLVANGGRHMASMINIMIVCLMCQSSIL